MSGRTRSEQSIVNSCKEHEPIQTRVRVQHEHTRTHWWTQRAVERLQTVIMRIPGLARLYQLSDTPTFGYTYTT